MILGFRMLLSSRLVGQCTQTLTPTPRTHHPSPVDTSRGLRAMWCDVYCEGRWKHELLPMEGQEGVRSTENRLSRVMLLWVPCSTPTESPKTGKGIEISLQTSEKMNKTECRSVRCHSRAR